MATLSQNTGKKIQGKNLYVSFWDFDQNIRRVPTYKTKNNSRGSKCFVYNAIDDAPRQTDRLADRQTDRLTYRQSLLMLRSIKIALFPSVRFVHSWQHHIKYCTCTYAGIINYRKIILNYTMQDSITITRNMRKKASVNCEKPSQFIIKWL